MNEKSIMRQMIEEYRLYQCKAVIKDCNLVGKVPNNVAVFLATCSSDPRELKNSLIRIGAFASMTKSQISLDLTKEVLRGIRLRTKTVTEGGWEFSAIRLVAFILPKESREEWLGDLSEAMKELEFDGYSRWAREAVGLGRVCLLGIALIRIRLQDLVSPGKKKRPL